MRRQWIDDGKPGNHEILTSRGDVEGQLVTTVDTRRPGMDDLDVLGGSADLELVSPPPEVLAGSDIPVRPSKPTSPARPAGPVPGDVIPDDDELEALRAEEHSMGLAGPAPPRPTVASTVEPDFYDPAEEELDFFS